MPTCVVCSGKEFICDSGFYFCVECQTQSQDVREIFDEFDGQDEYDDFCSQKDYPGSNVSDPVDLSQVEEETLTIWEAFNLSLIGLVDELIKLGAKPELKLTVLQLWSKYLGRMEVAFFSDEAALPKLGSNFRTEDAKLIFGHCSRVQEGPPEKNKNNSSMKFQESFLSPDTQPDGPMKKRIMRTAKKAVINQTYEEALNEMSSTSHSVANMTLDMLSCDDPFEEPEVGKSLAEQVHKVKPRDYLHPGLLLRSRLISFLYLGILLCEEDIKLSDMLRWIAEGHLSYNSLRKFFPETMTMGASNSALFVHYQPVPTYLFILKSTCVLAKYLQLQSYKISSPQKHIDHYIKQLNLPAQVGLIAKRLFGLLPPLPAYQSLSVSSKSLLNVEGRTMAHILVTMKLIFGLDDSTEYQNSSIAKGFNELIKSQRKNMQLFVWEDWERYCTLRKTAFSLFHFPSYMKNDLQGRTSTIQNAEYTISNWSKSTRSLYTDPRKAGRAKIMVQTMKSFLRKIENEESALETHDNVLESFLDFPPSTVPYSCLVDTIVNYYKTNTLKVEKSAWGNMLQNFPYERLSIDYGGASIEYLTHSKQFVLWAQSHGLEVGLHTGSYTSSINYTPYKQRISRKPTMLRQRKIFRVKAILDKPYTHCSDSSATSTALLREYRLRKPLILPKSNEQSERYQLPEIDVMHDDKSLEVFPLPKPPRKRCKSGLHRKSYKVSLDFASEEEKPKMLFIPNTEYWRSESCYPMNTKEFSSWWKLEKTNIPLSFNRLLDECADLIEMTSSDLYKEVLHIEALHEDLFPPNSKYLPDCPAHNDRLNTLKNWWWSS